MNVLQAVILTVLAIGVASDTCQPGTDVQVVLANRTARELSMWTPNGCIPETIKGYPVPPRSRKYADSLHQCHRLVFVKLEGGGTQLVAYNLDQPENGWNAIQMPTNLSNVINYAVTTWGSKLLIVGGRILNGPNGYNAVPQDSIWSLDCKGLAVNGKYDWQKLNFRLEIAAAGSCAVTTGDVLTVMSGMINPGDMVRRVFFYNILTGQRREGSSQINDRIIDCNSFRSKAMAIGMLNGSRLQAYAITPSTGVVNLLTPVLPVRHTKLQPARYMVNPQGPVKERFNIVGGTKPDRRRRRGKPSDITYYYFGGWNQGQDFPGEKGDVLGVIQ